jgi:3-isopropylmalate dehydrogenase
VTRDVAISLRRITRQCCERIAESAFALAQTRNRHVSIVHKANVLKIGDGMFIDACHEVARRYPEVAVDDFIVDAMMAHVVRAPARFDVIVTTNMFGDILSDHGSAPDIAGRDCANPCSLVLSAAMLLAWHGQRKGNGAFVAASRAIEQAVAAAIASGEMTADVGGRMGTREAGEALTRRLLQA